MGMVSKKRKQLEESQEEAKKLKGEEEAVEEEGLSPEKFRQQSKIVAVPREGVDSELPSPVQSFEAAPFARRLREVLAEAFPAPSPIQAQAWPICVAGRDLVAVAKTGSGKTLAFLLPAFKIIARWSKSWEQAPGQAPVLVLAPTRELATQIHAECRRFAPAKLRCSAVFGGTAKAPQAKELKQAPQVLVATPGRLQDFMGTNEVDLSQVQLLVLDEADRMLDMGFEPEIAKILSQAPDERQTLLFTATWPKAVRRIAEKYLKPDYLHVNVGDTEELAANKAVSQEFFRLGDDEKDDKLWQILSGLSDDAKVICFANTKRRIDGFQKTFWAKGFESVALHGDKLQKDRDRDLEKFAKGETWLLFATDVCSRGLDIKGVTHVVNLDMAGIRADGDVFLLI
ncbi:unnamed protein product [Effrenium voratum]|nr:unnamed protein product [Effrenium voratum]